MIAVPMTARSEVERELHWDACWNVRDLGGYATRAGGLTRWKSVVRAGNLSKLTEAGRSALFTHGIRTVIDLRDPREFEIDMDPFHERGVWAGQIHYLNEPLISDREWRALRDPETQQRGYVATLELSRDNIARVMAAVATAPVGGIVVHCHAGKERTGIVAALLLAVAGVADEIIAEDYVASDRYLGALYASWAAREEDPERRSRLMHGFQCKTEDILDALTHLGRARGADAYLRDAGVTATQLDLLRDRVRGSDRD